jgi:hypothetical protein
MRELVETAASLYDGRVIRDARAQSISGESSRLDPEIEHVVVDAAAEAPASPAEGNTRPSDSFQNS